MPGTKSKREINFAGNYEENQALKGSRVWDILFKHQI